MILTKTQAQAVAQALAIISNLGGLLCATLRNPEGGAITIADHGHGRVTVSTSRKFETHHGHDEFATAYGLESAA